MRTRLVPDSVLRSLPILLLASLLLPPSAQADIIGVTGNAFTLTAKDGHVNTPDGASIYSWGYALGSGAMQYPGPTLIVNEGDLVVLTLVNGLPAAAGNVSIVVPGLDVATSGGVAGLLTAEAPPGGSVTYGFVATRPGTFQYFSGTRPDLQVEMGLVGALIVRPSSQPFMDGFAYDHAATGYDRENLFLLTEMDVDIHAAAESQVATATPVSVATTPYEPEYWFVNGRCAPDTMAAPSLPGQGFLPHQPYDALVRMYPGERVLMRIVGGGREMHPFHHHGNHARVIAKDAHLLVNASGVLVGPTVFTITSVPGGTTDAIFEWTGKGLGWDMYGHAPGDGSICEPDAEGYDMRTREWCADHLKPFPVDLPQGQLLTYGGFWSGSPFLGMSGVLPPGEGGLNPTSGYTYMWHSHTEREMVNNDVFPGGMMTMLVVDPPGAAMP